MRALLLAALCSGTLAACRAPSNSATPELASPKISGAASKIKFKDAQEAQSALMPDYVRIIPLKTFGSLAGLRVGVEITANTSSGKVMKGIVTAIGKDAVTVEIKSWAAAGAGAPPAK